MQLEWMGQYRELMEKLIQYGNAYAQNYKIGRASCRERVWSRV